MAVFRPLLPRFAALLAIACAVSSCAAAPTQQTVAAVEQPTSAPSPAPATAAPPTVAPSPTAVPTIAENVFVAGVAVGGMDSSAARTELERSLAPLLRPLDVRAGPQELTLTPEDIGLELALDTMLDAALAAGAGAKVPLEIGYDEPRLRTAIEGLAEQLESGGEVTVIKATEPLSRSFAIAGGASLDVDAAQQQIDERLRAVGSPRRVTLITGAGSAAPPSPELLQEQLEELVAEWKGVAGVYVYDLASGAPVASVNAGSVFSAASTIKTAIMLNAYAHMPKFSARQEKALTKMIVESDNLEANLLLAASVGGVGTEEAILGAEQMSEMLADLGLENTYLWVPFEAADYMRINKLKYRCGPKSPVGPKPYTDTGCALRASPEEIAQLYIMLEQCSNDQGPLREKYPETLTAARCQEMIARLEKNGDKKRMLAGLPSGTVVAHKSGWIPDMQADAGIVRSPGGDYVVAIYLYRPLSGDGVPVPDRIMMSSIAGFSRLIYSYYNPIAAPAPGDG